MDWIVTLIDALGRLHKETGTMGFIAMGVILLIAFIAWRHSSKIIDIGEKYVVNQTVKTSEIVTQLSSLNTSNSIIAANTETNGKAIKELADAFGSDPEKTVTYIKTALAELKKAGRGPCDAKEEARLIRMLIANRVKFEGGVVDEGQAMPDAAPTPTPVAG